MGVETAVLYEVQKFSSEKSLLGFLGKQDGAGVPELVDHFRFSRDRKVPFYLMKAKGLVARSRLSESGAEEQDPGKWQEVFGMSWEALRSGLVQIGESRDGRPLIEVPLLPASKKRGLFLRLVVRYLEWDHSQDLDTQIRSTLEGMQRGLMSISSESPGYLTIVNSFNSSLVGTGETWSDWLIALVPRSWLLYKPSVQLAEVLAERAAGLLKIVPAGETGLQQIGAVFASAWSSLGKIEKLKEPSRWRSLVARLKQSMRGVKR
jgi:hypothetical protein